MAYKLFSLSDWRVNRTDYSVEGVSIITEGEAKGHNIQIDHTTLEELMAYAEQYKSGLKVKLDHGSGVEAIIGTVNNFRIEGDKLLGDLHLLQSHPKSGFILDLIEKQPDTFGFSVHFAGLDEEIDGIRYARVEELFSVDLVSEPAANATGVFSAKVEEAELEVVHPKKTKKSMSNKETTFTTGGNPMETIKANISGAISWDEEQQKFIFAQDKPLQAVDKSKTVIMAATQTKDTRPAIKDDKEPVVTGLEERMKAMEEAFSKHLEDYSAYKAGANPDPTSNKENVSEEMESQSDGGDASSDPAEPDADDKPAEPKKQVPTKAYSMDEAIRKEVIKQFSKIGVPAIKANPVNATPKKDDKTKSFEELISEQVLAGKNKSEAVMFCVKNHSEAHQAFLNNGGSHF